MTLPQISRPGALLAALARESRRLFFNRDSHEIRSFLCARLNSDLDCHLQTPHPLR